MVGGGWLRGVRLELDEREPQDYPYSIPAVAALRDELPLDPAITFLVGDNGSGKSTLIEAIAAAAGFNPEGGSRNFSFQTRDSTSPLHERLRLVRGIQRPATGYFLRAESFFNVATQIEQLGEEVTKAHGGASLHEQSHGESFISLALHRFGPRGLYLLDEPEAALSPGGCLAMLRRIHDLIAEDGQFVIATHSPLLMAYPGAVVYELDEHGIAQVDYRQTGTYQLFEAFLDSPDRFLRHLLDGPEP